MNLWSFMFKNLIPFSMRLQELFKKAISLIFVKTSQNLYLFTLNRLFRMDVQGYFLVLTKNEKNVFVPTNASFPIEQGAEPPL